MTRESISRRTGGARENSGFPQRRRETAGLILAAGRGTRFGPGRGQEIPKVLQPLLGRPMVSYVIETLRSAGVDEIVLVVGYKAEAVVGTLGDRYAYVVQHEQQGSGHAVRCASERFEGFQGSLVVMCGDSPLFRWQTVRAMLDAQKQTRAAVVLAAARLDDPTGYGRILRDEDGRVIAVLEEKCAGDRERAIKEVNGGAYVFEAFWLFANINCMLRNQAGEYNLTDMVRVAAEQGRAVCSVPCDSEEILGVNTPDQLKEAEAVLVRRLS